MPRSPFRLATDADRRDVDCQLFSRIFGPHCDALNHPWCLARGSAGAEACKFRKPKKCDVPKIIKPM